MPFLRFHYAEHEWGFEVSHGFIPAVGDTVSLWYAEPDDDTGDTESSIDGVIVNRRWGFASDFRNQECVEFDVRLESEIPEGCVPDSTEWPAAEWSKRKMELEAALERIRQGLPVSD